jgi:ABC-type uncharacterized transport system permease subunit
MNHCSVDTHTYDFSILRCLDYCAFPTTLPVHKMFTRVPPTVHNMPVKISDMVFFLSHDLFNLALDSNDHHKIVTYFL